MISTDEKELFLTLSNLCNLSYLEKNDLFFLYDNKPYEKNNSYLYNLKRPIFHKTGENCQYISSEFNDKIIIAFRGTSCNSEIFSGFHFLKEKLVLENYIDFKNYPHVHTGFYKKFISSKKLLNYKIFNYMQDIKDKNIIFTGHSLGGAVATIATLYYYYKFLRDCFSCVTFGSPRVGCSIFAKLFNKNIKNSVRFVNENDPITNLPSSWNFTHVDECKIIDNENDPIEGENIRGKFYTNFFYNHSCERYIETLESYICK